MKPIPKRIAERLSTGIKKFKKVLEDARSRDINESDTVVIITDILSEVFGYDKYSEITSEHAVRGTYCDLATQINGSLQYLLEVKAIGTDLKEQQIKQAIDYAANEGIEWVILTNGIHWNIFKVAFTKPIDKDLVAEFDFTELNPKKKSDLEFLYCISKEGCNKSVLEEFHSRKQILSKYFIANVVLTDPVLNVIKRQLRTIEPEVKTTPEQIEQILAQEVFKRDLLENEKSTEAKKKISRAIRKKERRKPENKKEKTNIEKDPINPPSTITHILKRNDF